MKNQVQASSQYDSPLNYSTKMKQLENQENMIKYKAQQLGQKASILQSQYGKQLSIPVYLQPVATGSGDGETESPALFDSSNLMNHLIRDDSD